jgi:hypothetical protein
MAAAGLIETEVETREEGKGKGARGITVAAFDDGSSSSSTS